MSKQNPVTEQTGLEEVNDNLTKMTQKMQDNKKMIAIWSCVVIAVVVLILAYVYFFRNPRIMKADEAIGNADLELALGNDSTALAQYKVLADDGAYEAGNRAALQAAIILYKQGKYQEAIKYLDDYSANENIIGPAAYSLKGDCYVNLDTPDYGKAADAFQKAVSESDANPAYTPFFMMKLARVYAAQKNYAEEAKVYEKILAEYPLYGSAHNLDVEKLLDRAKLRAEGK